MKYLISVLFLFSTIVMSQPHDDMENWFLYPSSYHVVYFESGEFMGALYRPHADSTNYYVEYDWEGDIGYLMVVGGDEDVYVTGMGTYYLDSDCTLPTIAKDIYDTNILPKALTAEINFLSSAVYSGQWSINHTYYLYKLDFVNVTTEDLYTSIMDADTGLFSCVSAGSEEIYPILETLLLGTSGIFPGAYVDELPETKQ